MQDVVSRVMVDMDQFRKHEVVEEQAIAEETAAKLAETPIVVEKDDPPGDLGTTQFDATQFGTTMLASDPLSSDSYKRDLDKAQSFDAPQGGTTLLTDDVLGSDSYLHQRPMEFPRAATATQTEQKEILETANAVTKSMQACQEYTDVAEVQFRQCSQVKDRTYMLKTYPRCFVGKQAVDALVATGVCPSRSAAVELGKSLMLAGVFFHVAKAHRFKDEELLYRFTSDFALLEKSGK